MKIHVQTSDQHPATAQRILILTWKLNDTIERRTNLKITKHVMMTKSDIIRNEKTHFELEVETKIYDEHECEQNKWHLSIEFFSLHYSNKLQQPLMGIAFIQFIKRSKQAIFQVSNIEYQSTTDMNTKTFILFGF